MGEEKEIKEVSLLNSFVSLVLSTLDLNFTSENLLKELRLISSRLLKLSSIRISRLRAPSLLSEAHAFRDSCSLTFVIAIKRAAPFSGSSFEWVNYETLLTVTFVKILTARCVILSRCLSTVFFHDYLQVFFFTSQLRTILLFFLISLSFNPKYFAYEPRLVLISECKSQTRVERGEIESCMRLILLPRHSFYTASTRSWLISSQQISF